MSLSSVISVRCSLHALLFSFAQVSDQEREEEKSESSSDSDDSAEIDLDDVEEGDPFMMQRANSECKNTESSRLWDGHEFKNVNPQMQARSLCKKIKK